MTLGELRTQVVDSAYERVLHKGGVGHRRGERAALRRLPHRLDDEVRVEFRRLNRQIRAAADAPPSPPYRNRVIPKPVRQFSGSAA